MKGILFKPWKIKFIAEHPDMEIQTRRVIKPQPSEGTHSLIKHGDEFLEEYTTPEGEMVRVGDYYLRHKPHYQVGETVYIKEAYWADYLWPEKPSPETRYIHYKLGHDDTPAARVISEDLTKRKLWQNPMFMPEWAARYFLVITDVRAERLQEIKAGDSTKLFQEGYPFGYDLAEANQHHPLSAFIKCWNSINAKWKRVYNPSLKVYEFWQFPWAEEDAKPIPKTTKHPERYHCIPNPFVWVYTFRIK